jgi:hypothetical protein
VAEEKPDRKLLAQTQQGFSYPQIKKGSKKKLQKTKRHIKEILNIASRMQLFKKPSLHS